jgi:SEC-C motif
MGRPPRPRAGRSIVQGMAPRSFSELLDKLRSQVGFLDRSCALFDAGHKDEGERLALATRVLLHDTSQSHSLLGQLGVKAAVRCTDTSIHTERETKHLGGGRYSATFMAHAGLVLLQAQLGPPGEGAWTYAPLLAPESPERIHPPVPFASWWERPFLTDTTERPVTRKSVTLAVANKDGGAHVARAIPEAFRRLSAGQSMPFRTGSDDTWSEMPGVVMATMRQIAFELLDTLHRDLPNFVASEPLAATAEFTAAEKAAVPRNAKCLCGSGKKFKHCHGS